MAPMPEFFDVVLWQRAHRVLKPDAIGDDLLERVLEAATHAPSAENRQPWAFVVVRDANVRERMAAMVRAVWDGGVRDLARRHLGDRFFVGVERWATVGFGEAPVLIVVCGDTSVCDEALLPSSIFPATQNLLLAAGALGLGSLLNTLPLLAGRPLYDLLALPAHMRPMAVISLGWPAQPLRKPTRIPFPTKSFRDRYGNPW